METTTTDTTSRPAAPSVRSPNRKPRTPRRRAALLSTKRNTAYVIERGVGYSVVKQGGKRYMLLRVKLTEEEGGLLRDEARQRGIRIKDVKAERVSYLRSFIVEGKNNGVILPADVADRLRKVAENDSKVSGTTVSLVDCVANILRQWCRQHLGGR